MASPSITTKRMIVRYKGTFDLEGLYRVIVQWLKSRRYWFHETTYKHKAPTPLGVEEQIRFYAERKVTDYYRYDIGLFLHIWHMKEVEVIKNGKKKKLVNAKMDITIQGHMILDYQGKFEKSPFFLKLRDFYHKYILFHLLENTWYDTLYYRTIKLQAVIKDYLEIEAKSHEYEAYMGDNA